MTKYTVNYKYLLTEKFQSDADYNAKCGITTQQVLLAFLNRTKQSVLSFQMI